MDYPKFWHLVDSSCGQPDRADRLTELLKQLPPDEIVRFRLVYDDLLHTSNKVDLWGAAHTINGGCSDEGFVYFREGLIELGRPVFESAVRDPDSLADIVRPGESIEGTEGLGNAATTAWIGLTGQTEEQFYEEVDRTDTRTNRGDAEDGEWWNFDDRLEVEHRLPRLAAKCLPAEEE